MNQFTPLIVGVIALTLGSILGYYARQSIAKKQAGTLEAKIQQKVSKAKEDSEALITEAKAKAEVVIDRVRKEVDARRTELSQTEQFLLKKESVLDQKVSDFEIEQKGFQEKVEKLKR